MQERSEGKLKRQRKAKRPEGSQVYMQESNVRRNIQEEISGIHVSFITDQGSGKLNEDTSLITPNLFGVFDGATGWIKYFDENGKTAGLLAAETAKEVFEKNQNNSMMASLEEITRVLKERMGVAHINTTDKAQLWQTTASVVRVNDNDIEYVQIGDSPIVFVFKDGSIQAITKDHDIDTLKEWMKVADKGVQDVLGDESIQGKLLGNRREANIAYGVLNGEIEALRFVQKGSVSRDNLAMILLFSDGMLLPKENPEAPEDYEKLIELFHNGGLEEIRASVRSIELSDPKCLKYPRFKEHDDLTGIAIVF